ncbi:glycosyl transferase family 2 [Paludibacter propionicigenes WB4]|uniref:Glycosyl transferase family 2 n=1 Tax=Paludibacter propionicigenes (strain DSM 17365 / JCM 13257 / WB4) TaxID=694427 RepID=E4T322_PALPW|nr:glycosyltransferase family 2 protein [Paludibacter propionicigenes]ADQ79116.1 glycosyl transferase family 2 [Paludibacter propionicigenes WB4]
MKLSILIPTYNRSIFLLKNLELLSEYIVNGSLQNEIEIIVSNNNSNDNTHEVITQFRNEQKEIRLKYFLQKENIGLEKNALFTLKNATGKFVMYLGDDDYIEQDYLMQSLDYLNNHPETYCVIPSFISIDVNGNYLAEGRDNKLENSHWKAGFNNCVRNSWRGHQLSGLIMNRDGLLDSYIERKLGNIYPFIYFVAYSCLNGDTFHFTKLPVKITQPGQENKNWNYGKDGLINEIFDNYLKLPISNLERTILQLDIYKKQSWRLWMYHKINNKELLKAFFYIWFSKNSTNIFKFFFPIEVAVLFTSEKIKRIIK